MSIASKNVTTTNVVSFPAPSLCSIREASAVNEAIAAWESKAPSDDGAAYLVKMADDLARKVAATPDKRDPITKSIDALERLRQRYDIATHGGAIYDAAVARFRAKSDPANANSDGQTLNSARASSFEMKAIQWLWPGRFALGKLGLLVGLPDEGKGQVFCDMAARVTQGWDWPCGEGKAPKGNVILLTAEDDISDTIRPRLAAAGADCDRVEIVKMVRDSEKERMFSLVTDLHLLRQKIEQVGGVKLVQIDPITAYLGNGKVDSFRTTDVRSVLAPVVEFAADLHVSVVGIMHFNKKTDVDNALLRVSDSLAFGATARHVYAVVDDAENKRKLFVKAKNNLSAVGNKALAYRFGGREVGNDPRTGEAIFAPYILWEGQHVDVTATEAMQYSVSTLSSKEFGHKTERLVEGAEALGLVVEDGDHEVFSLIADTNVVMESRYIKTGAKRWPAIEALGRTCKNTRDGVGRLLRERGVMIRL
jgi:hypothetical protein